jgi:Flp pilus assembly protein TadG
VPRFRRPHRSRGQAIVEFALVLPVLLLLVLGVADFGRMYASVVAVEAASREAADLGAFDPGNWNAGLSPTNPGQTVVRMEAAACGSAAQSHLEGYAEPPGTINHATCTNPSFSCTLEQPGQGPADCASYTGGAGGCGDAATNPPCVVHVALTYEFDTLTRFPLVPSTVTFTRDARYAVSGLSTGAP